MKRKRESAAKRAGFVVLSLLFACLALFLLVKLGAHFHPGVGQENAEGIAFIVVYNADDLVVSHVDLSVVIADTQVAF